MGAYGSLIGLLLGGAGLTALAAHNKANRLNQYEDGLNSNLTAQGIPALPFKHHNFSFGSQSEADDQLYKNAMEAYQNKTYLQDSNGNLPSGVSPMQSPAYAKEYNTGVAFPDKVDSLKRNKDYGETQDLQDAWNQSHPPLPPQQGQPSMPAMFTSQSTLQSPQLNQPTLDQGPQTQQPLVGLGQGADGAPLLAAGAVKQEPPHIKPADYLSMIGHQVGQQNADTSSARQKAEARKAEMVMKKTTAEIANIQQIMKLRPAESKAKIAKLGQKTGHSPNAIEMMLSSGKSPKQIGDILYRKTAFEAGIMPEEDNGAPDPAAVPDGLTPGAKSYLGQ